MWRADAHFRMGSSHAAEGSPCQDYALARDGFAVVSDGCSTSGRTDVGARVWGFAAAANLTLAETVDRARLSKGALGLSMPDMDATLGVVTPVYGMLFGDGTLAAHGLFGDLIVTVEWAGNMPGYPSYWLDNRRLAEFVDQSNLAAGGISPCRVTRYENGTKRVYGYSAVHALCGITVEWPEGADVVAAFTDGASQIGGVEPLDAVRDLLSIGSAREGAFAHRRLNGAIKRWAKSGSAPVDDIAMAALSWVPDDV